jgi:predicted RNA binding protein YcfA (HicA-like mRNA interferase family)
MGSKYPILPPEDIITALKKAGYLKVSQKGSHSEYRKDGNPVRTVIVPMHHEVARGTLQSIRCKVYLSRQD